jgi:hypothetical protein
LVETNNRDSFAVEMSPALGCGPEWPPYVTACFAIVVVMLNSAFLATEIADQSWGALFVALYASPIINCFIAISSITYFLIARREMTYKLRTLHILTSVLLPIVAAAGLFLAPFFLNLHGC